MNKELIQKEIEWVDNFALHLRRTNDLRNIQKSLALLAKRKLSLTNKLNQEVDLV